jgi:prevent-host-death family protein
MSTSQPIHFVPLEQAQADLAGLIARLQADGEIIITESSRPIAKLVAPPQAGTQPAERKLGTMPGSVLYMAPDFDAPLEDFREYM